MESPPKGFNGDSAIVLDPRMVSDKGRYKMLILYAKVSVAEKEIIVRKESQSCFGAPVSGWNGS